MPELLVSGHFVLHWEAPNVSGNPQSRETSRENVITPIVTFTFELISKFLEEGLRKLGIDKSS